MKECKADPRTFHHTAVLMERILYIRWLNCQKLPFRSVAECQRRCWVYVPVFVKVYKDITGILFFIKTVMLIVTWDTHDIFTRLGVICPFPIDMSDFCRQFRVQNWHHSQNLHGIWFYRRQWNAPSYQKKRDSWYYCHTLI